MECRKARGIALLGGDFVVVGSALIAAAALLVALGRDILREQLAHELVVARMRKAELQERRRLQRLLRRLARLVVHTRQLHQQPVVLHTLDDGLVHAHAVHAAADHLDDARIASGERLLHLLLNGRQVVGERGLVGYDRLAQLLLVHAEREGRAALEVEPETQLLLGGEGYVYGEDGDDQQRQPFPDVVARRV